MSWKETRVMDERLRFISMCIEGELSVSESCRIAGISRKTGYKWLGRYYQRGPAGLEDRSRAPLCHPNAIDDQTMELLLSTRRRHKSWGPRKVLEYLSKRHHSRRFPAASSVGALYKRHGLVKKRRRRHHAPGYNHALIMPSEPNEVWSADFKGPFRTGDRIWCYPFTLSDGFSRYFLRCDSLARTRHADVKPLFERAFRDYGLPLAIRTDNGPPFASTGLGGLARLSIWWIKLGIFPERIEPGRPEQNGRHERLHKTLKEDTLNPPARNMRAQQRAFGRFLAEYNDVRPHEALGYKTPSCVYRTSSREYPRKVPKVEYPSGFEVRRPCHSGQIKWRGTFVYVSQALQGEPVGLIQTGNSRWKIFFGHMELGILEEKTGKIERPTFKKRRYL